MLTRENLLGLFWYNGIYGGVVKHGVSFALSYIDAHECIEYTPSRHPELEQCGLRLQCFPLRHPARHYKDLSFVCKLK